MGVETLIARGIGFAPGSTQYIPTHGLTPSAAVAVAGPFRVAVAHVQPHGVTVARVQS